MRVCPFVVATVEPMLMGWNEPGKGILMMNLVTGALLASLMLGGRSNMRKYKEETQTKKGE